MTSRGSNFKSNCHNFGQMLECSSKVVVKLPSRPKWNTTGRPRLWNWFKERISTLHQNPCSTRAGSRGCVLVQGPWWLPFFREAQLSFRSRLYSIHSGSLRYFLNRAKVLLQDLWAARLDWDDPLRETLAWKIARTWSDQNPTVLTTTDRWYSDLFICSNLHGCFPRFLWFSPVLRKCPLKWADI